MTIETKTKSHPKPVVNLESILESVKSNESFSQKAIKMTT